MKKLNNFLSSIEFEHASPVEAKVLDRFEDELGLTFGKTTKAIICRYGCLVVGANELYGVCGKNKAIPSAIHATKSARKDPNFPSNLLVIAEDGAGKKYCVDDADRIFQYEFGTLENLKQKIEGFAVEFLGG